MSLLSTAEIAAMRTTLATSLPSTCTVQRAAAVTDPYGGAVTDWTTPTTVATVACRVSPSGRTPEERVFIERLQSVYHVTVTLPADTDVTSADRIVVAGRTYEVVGVLRGRSWEISRRVVCAEVG